MIPGRCRSGSGFTLLEVVISAAIFSLLLAISLGLIDRTNRHVGEGMKRADTANRAGTLARLIATELRSAVGSTIRLSSPSPSSGSFTAISYRQATGFDTIADAIVLGPRRELRFVVDPGEVLAATPVDDDGDGLVDEGTLLLFQDTDGDDAIGAGEQVGVVARDLNGSTLDLSFPGGGQTASSQDGELRITFDIQRRLGLGEVQSSHKELTIALRNK